MLLVHPASAGHGLNLQDGGNILVFFGLNWNLEQRLQVIERIGPVRQLQAGHDRPVFIYNILAKDTIDELVLDRVETKREVQDLLLEAMARKRRRVA
jgi:SNF2 family DNA or RNA helicase